MNFISVEENQTDEKQLSKNNKRNKNSPKSKSAESFKSKNGFTKKRSLQRGRGVIYLGHIPHGFYEDEMKSYFNQFGKVISTTVCRSKKTGRSRGYGFVQFEDEEVAKIAAETMNNYLMYNKILKCRYIPPEERKNNVYESKIDIYSYPRQRNRRIELINKSKAFSKLNQATYLKKVQKKINEFKNYFEKNGINFTLKLNDGINQDNSTNNKNEENETKTSSNRHEETENETDNINGVLEIDESEDEISFKTPPQVKKVIKKSLNSTTLPSLKHKLVEKSQKNNSNRKIIKNQEKNKKKEVLKETQKNKKTVGNLVKIKKKSKLLKKIKNKKLEKMTINTNTDTAVSKNPERKIKKNSDVLKLKLNTNIKKRKIKQTC